LVGGADDLAVLADGSLTSVCVVAPEGLLGGVQPTNCVGVPPDLHDDGPLDLAPPDRARSTAARESPLPWGLHCPELSIYRRLTLIIDSGGWAVREQGWGRGHEGRGGRAGGGRRGGRGDVRAAVLALLAERPMHGYEMLAELSRRTRDLWRPSPGSLYPALQLLEVQGLVRAVAEHGRRRFELTAEGRALQAQNAIDRGAPWEAIVSGADEGALALRGALRGVEQAASQVAEAGTPEQKATAEALLTELRRRLYLLLAGPSDPRDGGSSFGREAQ
jgi:DNA-binding PadR family transcriptional regulator